MLKNFYSLPSGKDPQGYAECQSPTPPQEIPDLFVIVPAKWIRTGRRPVLNLYTKRDYKACSVFSSVYGTSLILTFPHYLQVGDFYAAIAINLPDIKNSIHFTPAHDKN